MIEKRRVIPDIMLKIVSKVFNLLLLLIIL